MRFKEPLQQYLYRWFREKTGSPVVGGVIIFVNNNDATERLKFIQTSYSGYNTHWWHTHDRDGKVRDNWLEEYVPTSKEKRHSIKTVFALGEEVASA